MKKNQNARRTSAHSRLEEQLKRGTKLVEFKEVKLTDKNIKRINKEIQKLESKIRKNG
tara:strand:+ start:661 stop:834 length:174 start_codon:yes stop_codon:yes gene_type:complete